MLVAESFNRRYFNVVQLLSLNIPMIAVQMDVIETDGAYVLNFTKIMDIYEEPELELDTKEISEESWQKEAPWVNDFAKDLLNELLLVDSNLHLKHNQRHMSISTKGGQNQFDFNKRANPNVRIYFRVLNQELAAEIKDLFSKNNVDIEYNKHKCFSLTFNKSDKKVLQLLVDSYKLKHNLTPTTED